MSRDEHMFQVVRHCRIRGPIDEDAPKPFDAAMKAALSLSKDTTDRIVVRSEFGKVVAVFIHGKPEKR